MNDDAANRTSLVMRFRSNSPKPARATDCLARLHPLAGLVLVMALSATASAAELTKKTDEAFNKYVAATEARMAGELKSGSPFLYVDSLPLNQRFSAYDRLKHGEVLVYRLQTRAPGVTSDIPDGMVHHWVGLVFIPGVTMAQALPVLLDYDHRAELYKPEVTSSRLISHNGDDYHVFLRLYEKKFTTVAFNTEYDVHWGRLDAHRQYSNSISTRITQLRDPDNPAAGEYPVGGGSGFLWRFNTYWRFQEKDGGLYMQCEALSLTRDIPWAVRWLIRPLVTRIPRDALNRALGRTRQVVRQKAEALGKREVAG
jgi:hypothetical protein